MQRLQKAHTIIKMQKHSNMYGHTRMCGQSARWVHAEPLRLLDVFRCMFRSQQSLGAWAKVRVQSPRSPEVACTHDYIIN